MYKPFIKKLHLSTAIIASSLMFATPANASKADLSQEIVITAERQAGDLKNKIASYLDDVVITQGSLVIHADLVQVIEHDATDSKTYLAKGKPATFEQLLDDGTPIKLEANEITYEPLTHTITISGGAKLSQEGSEVSGDKIVYNTLTEQLEAQSKPTERITTILKPKSKDKANKE